MIVNIITFLLLSVGVFLLFIVNGCIIGILKTVIEKNETIRREVEKMSAALDALKQKVAEIDERDDQIVSLINDLKAQVADLQAQLDAMANVDPELQGLADKLAETVEKFNTVLPTEPPIT